MSRRLLPAMSVRLIPSNGTYDRIFVKQPHDHEVAGPAGLIGEIVFQLAVCIDRLGQIGVVERRVSAHVHFHAGRAIEQGDNPLAYLGFERGLIEFLRLRLAGHDQARGIRSGGFHGLSGEENE